MQIAERDGKLDIRSMLPEELAAWLEQHGEKRFRAKQIFRWLTEGAADFSAMTDLSAALREKLGESFFLTPPTVLREQRSKRDGTVKYLWRLADGNAVESVLMRYSYGDSACISSQVGCRMGCVFCASTGMGRVRDLLPSEMLDQVRGIELRCGVKLSHVVLMGIGEPLDNFDNVLRFLELLNRPEGMNLGMRHVSISTCGLTEGIDKLAGYRLQCTLSVSLHAPDDETRDRLVPANRGRGVKELMRACSDYYAATGRRVSFEYALIRGVNDSPEQARQLAALVKPIGGHVNLIPLNEVEGSPLHPGDAKTFAARLKELGVNVTVRRRLGTDIDAACGQLRRKSTQDSALSTQGRKKY